METILPVPRIMMGLVLYSRLAAVGAANLTVEKTCGEGVLAISMYKRVSNPKPVIVLPKEPATSREAMSVVIVKTGTDEPQTIIKPVIVEKKRGLKRRFGVVDLLD